MDLAEKIQKAIRELHTYHSLDVKFEIIINPYSYPGLHQEVGAPPGLRIYQIYGHPLVLRTDAPVGLVTIRLLED